MSFKNCVINESVQCNKCVIIASVLFEQLVKVAQEEQHLIYQLSDVNKTTKHIIYTNTFNIAIDLVFRMTYRISKLFRALKSIHGVKTIILFNDLTARLVMKTEEQYKQEADNMLIHDHKTFQEFKRSFFIQLIVKAFKKWCLYYSLDEEEDYDPIEQSLAIKYPEYYDFNMKDWRAKYIIDPLTCEDYKLKKVKSLYNLINRIIDVQTVLTPKIIDKCCELVLWNLEHQQSKQLKELKVFTTNTPNIDERFVFSLFPDEAVIYITKTAFNSKLAFFIHNFRLCYPYIKYKQMNLTLINEDKTRLIQLIIGDNMTINTLINKYNKSKKSNRVNSFIKLLTTCQNESVCGAVLDINANYRYTVFENIKSLIVDKLIETEFPPHIEDKEIVWITLDDYMEQLPAWISQFNHISHVKLN